MTLQEYTFENAVWRIRYESQASGNDGFSFLNWNHAREPFEIKGYRSI